MRSPRAAGFTFLELLVVITIIMILAGLVVGVSVTIREKSRELSTSTRMNDVLNALSQYGMVEGSVSVGLQSKLPLGGVASFATISTLDKTVVAPTPKPPGSKTYLSGSYVTVDSTNYTSSPERRNFYSRMSVLVFEAVPPPGWSGTTSNDYVTKLWPTQWPETDWDKATPGSNPPILRFPWGKCGLKADGTICDPAVAAGAPAGPNPPQIREFTTTAGSEVFGTAENLYNAWATTGTPATGAIWNWNAVDSTQTDAVTLTSVVRSDGTSLSGAALNANLPMPFDLGYLSPLRSIDFLQAAGTVPGTAAGADQYRTDRKPSRLWNDAWGSPLIVSYALFQPERYMRTFDEYSRRDLLLRSALKEYGYNRSLYVTVGAPGSVLSSGVPKTWSKPTDDTTLRLYWRQIRTVCNAVEWTENSFVKQPWSGARVRSSGSPKMKCMLNAPMEIK